MSKSKTPAATCDCQEVHRDGCPVAAAEMSYWARYFGIKDRMSRDERKAQLATMKPTMADDSEEEEEF